MRILIRLSDVYWCVFVSDAEELSRRDDRATGTATDWCQMGRELRHIADDLHRSSSVLVSDSYPTRSLSVQSLI